MIKLNQRQLYERLGVTSRSRAGLATQYAPSQAATRLRGITLQVGRTGALTPVAELAPVAGGSTIERAASTVPMKSPGAISA